MKVCEAARKNCYMKETIDKMTIGELEDEEHQQGEERH